jgi:hypothetical protein
MIQADVNSGARALGDAIAGLLQAPARMAGALAGSLTGCGPRGCEIPPPCWEPRPAGTCSLMLPPGSVARIRVHVMNCAWSRRVVGITAAGRLAGWMKLEPTTQIAGPQETVTFVVSVRIPDTVPIGQMFSGPLLVRGCLDHFARIDVRIAECAVPACCDIVVKDCPDNIHHWYDHFYCPRPCRTVSTQDVPNRDVSYLDLKNG